MTRTKQENTTNADSAVRQILVNLQVFLCQLMFLSIRVTHSEWLRQAKNQFLKGVEGISDNLCNRKDKLKIDIELHCTLKEEFEEMASH